jgi:hypothetical protein
MLVSGDTVASAAIRRRQRLPDARLTVGIVPNTVRAELTQIQRLLDEIVSPLM